MSLEFLFSSIVHIHFCIFPAFGAVTSSWISPDEFNSEANQPTNQPTDCLKKMMMKTTITYGNKANKEIKAENIVIAWVNTHSFGTYVVFGGADDDDGKRWKRNIFA